MVLLKKDVLHAYKVSIKIILIKGGSFMLVIGADHGNKQMLCIEKYNPDKMPINYSL